MSSNTVNNEELKMDVNPERKPLTDSEIQEMINNANQQAEAAVKNASAEDMAAYYFQKNSPELRKQLRNISLKDARRLIEALVMYPLMENEPSFYAKEAKNIFALGNNLIDAKYVMRSAVEYERFKELETLKGQEAETKQGE